MANLANHPTLAQSLRVDGKWLRCAQCDLAYWGAFRPTDFVAAKLAAHAAKAHGAAPVKAARPARRKQAAAAGRSNPPKASPRSASAGDAQMQAPASQASASAPSRPSDPLAGLGALLDPRLQLAQGPRMFEESGGDRQRQASRRQRERMLRQP